MIVVSIRGISGLVSGTVVSTLLNFWYGGIDCIITDSNYGRNVNTFRVLGGNLRF